MSVGLGRGVCVGVGAGVNVGANVGVTVGASVGVGVGYVSVEDSAGLAIELLKKATMINDAIVKLKTVTKISFEFRDTF
jgi:prefoldin subunit 5